MSADEKLINAMHQHIDTHIGNHQVFHEIFSPDIHVDIYHAYPSSQYPFHTLITGGMASKAMTTPSEYSHMQYAELMLCLPQEWNLNFEDMLRDERNTYWPIGLLKYLARLPHDTNSFLSILHTVDHPEEFNVLFPASFLYSPVLFPESFKKIECDDKIIHLFSVIPIYKDELAYICDGNAEDFLDTMELNEITELLIPNRRPIIRMQPL